MSIVGAQAIGRLEPTHGAWRPLPDAILHRKGRISIETAMGERSRDVFGAARASSFRASSEYGFRPARRRVHHEHEDFAVLDGGGPSVGPSRLFWMHRRWTRSRVCVDGPARTARSGAGTGSASSVPGMVHQLDHGAAPHASRLPRCAPSAPLCTTGAVCSGPPWAVVRAGVAIVGARRCSGAARQWARELADAVCWCWGEWL